MEILEINDSNVDILLEQFDKDGFIIDKNSKEKVRCNFTDHLLKRETLGGILPGSCIFIEDSDVAYPLYYEVFE